MQVSATAKRLRISPRKARLVAGLVRGKPVGSALQILAFEARKGAGLVRKVLDSAVANAENENADIDELRIAEIYVNQGIAMKRVKPRAKGRADRILKRTCHVTVTVSDE